MKELFLLRGLPGAGKTTLAKSLGGLHIEADNFFMKEDVYEYNPTKVAEAHAWCQSFVSDWIAEGRERIVVANTFTQEWEMQPYFTLAEKYGYRVYSLIVENRHDGVNQHGVPVEKIIEMKNRFQVKL